MGLRIRTALARRRAKRRRQGGHRKWLLIFFVLILAPAGLVLSLRPKLTAYAENYVEYEATMAMEQAAAECTAKVGGIGRVQTDETGAVQSLTTDAASVNQLRTDIVQQVYTEIGELERAHTGVAVGTLIDPQYMAGLGPKLWFGVTALGQVKGSVHTAFSSAGINQTLYQITITITAEFSIETLGTAKEVTISAEYPLEETIVVGDVPMISAGT